MLFGKRAAIDAQDARLDAAAVHAREAVALLDGAEHPGVVQVRDGAAALAQHLDDWRFLTGGKRWSHGYDGYMQYSGAEGMGQRLSFAADGIDAIESGRGAAWLAEHIDGNALRRSDRLVGLRLVVDARPGRLDPLVEAMVPELDFRGVGDSYTAERSISALVRLGVAERGRAVDWIWDHMVRFGNGTSDFGAVATDGAGNSIDTRTRASVVKAMFGAASEHRLGGRAQEPAWLARLADDDLVALDVVTRTQLDLLTRATTRADVEQLVLESLRSPDRMRYGALDTGAATYAAALELPEALRPSLHESVVRDIQEVRRASHRIWSSAHDDRLAAGAAPSSVLASMLSDPLITFSRADMYRSAIAMLDRVPRDGPRAPVVASTRELLERNLERTNGLRTDGYGLHPDYAEHGRALANAQLLARFDDMQKPGAPPDGAVLAW
ncbi:MAG: hypothetical protein JWL76_2322 [Thermoleophilia bacterium]|nr:hypothetical protein [Thermoleophilia bacterium]